MQKCPCKSQPLPLPARKRIPRLSHRLIIALWKAHNKFDIESIKRLTKQMIVLFDSREKRNEHILLYFDKQGITYRKEKLDFGDYTFLLPSTATGQGDIYFHDSIVIERKASLEEFFLRLRHTVPIQHDLPGHRV